MTRERIFTLLAYNTFFWVAFWLFAYWTFPYERLAAYLTDKINERGTGYTLEIGSVSPYWLTGVELADVKLRKFSADAPAPATTPAGKAAGAPADGAIKIASAHARLGLFALLTGGRSVNFGADLGQGEVDGSYRENGEEKMIVADLSQVDLAKLGVLESLVSLPMKGTLTGKIDLTLGKLPSKTSGKIDLKIQKLTVGDGKAKLKVGSMGGLTVEPISAGDVHLELDAKDGVGNVRKLSANGPDLKLEGSGDMRFAAPLSHSRVNILLRLAFTDAYKNKSPRTKAMFTLLEGSGSPQIAAAKTPDGGFQFRLSGTLSSARAVPAGQREPSAPGMPPPPPAALPNEPGDEED